MPKPIITINYLKSIGFIIPDSSIDSVNDKLEQLIEQGEEDYLQNTIGYELTSALYALVEPYPSEVLIFLDGLLVDGELFYRGIKKEISSFIMAHYYGQNSININNSGFSMPVADGENMIQPNFSINALINETKNLRYFTFNWLCDNANDFFSTWDFDMFKKMDSHSVW